MIGYLAMNFGSIFRAVDAFMALTEAAKRFKSGSPSYQPPDTTLTTAGQPQSGGLAGHIEARLTNVVVAALKEAFDRDHARLELERAQLDEQRRRAEAALRLEMRRQAADRELSRLRLLAAIAMVGWLASVLFLAFRAADVSNLARAAVGTGWLLLLGSLGTAFMAQGRVGAFVDGEQDHGAGTLSLAALWLLMAGLAVSAMSLLV